MSRDSPIPRFSQNLEERVAAHLVQLLHHPDNLWTFRDTVLDLGQLGPPARALLLQILQDPTHPWWEPALSVLERWREPQATAALVTIMQSEVDLELRKKAAHALGSLGSATAIQPLATLLFTTPDVSFRRIIVGALGDINDINALPALESALDDADRQVRQSAISGLGRLADPRVLDLLLRGLRDSDPVVRMVSIDWITKIQADPVIPALIEALSDPNAYVRQRAVFALAEIGDRRAFPVLQWMMEHDTAILEDGPLAENAAHAVACIEERLA